MTDRIVSFLGIDPDRAINFAEQEIMETPYHLQLKRLWER